MTWEAHMCRGAERVGCDTFFKNGHRVGAEIFVGRQATHL